VDEDRIATALDEFRVALREMNLRQERVLTGFMAELADSRAQLRANTEATWRMLDRWGEGPTPAS
jgi:hypothetical protein